MEVTPDLHGVEEALVDDLGRVEVMGAETQSKVQEDVEERFELVRDCGSVSRMQLGRPPRPEGCDGHVSHGPDVLCD